MQLPASNSHQLGTTQSQTPLSGHSRSESQSSTVSAANKAVAANNTDANVIKPAVEVEKVAVESVGAETGAVSEVVTNADSVTPVATT